MGFCIFELKINEMSENTNNPLGLKDKSYTDKEFATEIRRQFGTDDYVSNFFLFEIFLAK